MSALETWVLSFAPPAMRTRPSLSTVAVEYSRAVPRMPVRAKPTGGATVSEVVPKIAGFEVALAVIATGPPAFTPVATPEVLIVAIELSADFQSTGTLAEVPSENSSSVMKVSVWPAATVGFVGNT